MTKHPDPVGDALANLAHAINEVDRVLAEPGATLTDQAEWLKVLDWTRGDFTQRGLYQQLAMVISSHKSRMAGQMPYGEQVEVPGVGVLTYSSSGGKTTWDWPALVPVIAAQVADEVVDPATGVVPPVAVICERGMDALGDVIGLTPSKQGRKNKLKDRGLDVKRYVTTTDAEPSVRFL